MASKKKNVTEETPKGPRTGAPNSGKAKAGLALKRERATERREHRAHRSPAEQLEEISTRAGASLKETARLRGEVR